MRDFFIFLTKFLIDAKLCTMSEESNLKTYLCASADWEVVVTASSHEEAASLALQEQVNKMTDRFCVGAVISVVPIRKDSSDMHLVYAPTILADIGLHRHASELIKHIDENNG